MEIGTAIMNIHPKAIPGEDFSILEGYDRETGAPTKSIGKWNEAKLGPKPNSIEALQTWADENTVAVLKELKRKELEVAYQTVWDEQFGTQIAVGLTLYFEFPNDPRTVIVKTARTNFISKTNSLNELGKPGKPALTEANIAAVVW